MHVFLSAGEPSGDLHAANLARALRHRDPNATIVGFGGDKLSATGADVLFPLTQLAVMWFGKALMHLPTFFRVAKQAEDYFRDHKPDAVILIDFPGFHWHIAKRAKAAGIPVYYFVPPQLWAWASWRVNKMRRTVDRVLTALPFEDTWYAERGVPTHYVGHPYFDEIARQQLDPAFMAEQRRDSRPVISLLPGSRNQEIDANFDTMANTAAKIAAARPDVRFLVAAFNDRQAETVRKKLAGRGLSVEVHVGRTPEIIELATACVSVSGSVSLEIMCRRKPAVVVYKLGRAFLTFAKQLKKCRYISLVNLLADEELFPEYLSHRDESTGMAQQVVAWLADPAAYEERVAKLTALKDRAAIPGACERAADFIARSMKTKASSVRTAA